MAMETPLVVDIFYYDGNFYLPTSVYSVDGVPGMSAPVAIIPATERATLAEAIEFKAIEGNATLSRADFRLFSEKALLAAMGLRSRTSFFELTKRWAIVARGDGYVLYPHKPSEIRGVVRDEARAESLPAATFAADAAARMLAQLPG